MGGEEMARKPHPKKEVEQALKHAEAHGWRVDVGGKSCLGQDILPLQ